MTFNELYPNVEARTKVISSYLKSNATYLIALEDSILLAYLCSDEDFHTMTRNGNCLYIQYFEGSIKVMLEFLDPDKIKYIAFQRNGIGKIRKYKVDRFLSKVL